MTGLQILWSMVRVVILLYCFLVGVEALSSGIKSLGSGVMDDALGAETNPFVGLVIGILATTLVQSSSVTTSLVVGLVGSGQVSVAAAVPIIMGANIGTTVTNTIASMAHAARSVEFRRAFAAATCHDFFNFLAVAVLLPVELLGRAAFGVGPLEGLSGTVAGLLVGSGGASYHSPLKSAFKAGVKGLSGAVEAIGFSGTAAAIALAIAGAIIIFVTLALIVRVMRVLVLARIEVYINRFLGAGGPVAMLVGVLVTVSVQSSSITTSLLVPLAGAGIVTLGQIYPITLGANIGTTVTALLASMAASGSGAGVAVQIALVHFFFNVVGILLLYVPMPVRDVPLKGARWLAGVAARSRRWAVAYVLGMFYALPAVLVMLGRWLGGGA
ncbi:MAG: Na/Pi symporter [Deltaproteobacteria bacterium]|nr:Na/Pi symporter [Deltaproteobacteria bacterium]